MIICCISLCICYNPLEAVLGHLFHYFNVRQNAVVLVDEMTHFDRQAKMLNQTPNGQVSEFEDGLMFQIRTIRMSGLFLILSCVSTFAQPAESADPDLAEIRAILSEYTRSIETIEGRQEVVFKHKKISRAPNAGTAMEDLTVDTVFQVDLIHGRKKLVSTKTWYYRELSQEPFKVAQTWCFDGMHGYFLDNTLWECPLPSNVPSNVPDRLHIRRKDETVTKQSIWELAGLPCPGLGISLAAIVSAADATIQGPQTIDGHRCIHVVATSGAWRVEASLDPMASCLPRRLAVKDMSPRSEPVFVEEVFEFQQFPSGSESRPIWFPVRGRETHLGMTKTEIQLKEARFNTQMKEADFQISAESLPPGVLISGPGGNSFTGNREDLWQDRAKQVNEETDRMMAIVAESRAALATSSDPVKVQPRPTNRWIAVALGLASAAMLFTGLRIMWKRSS